MIKSDHRQVGVHGIDIERLSDIVEVFLHAALQLPLVRFRRHGNALPRLDDHDRRTCARCMGSRVASVKSIEFLAYLAHTQGNIAVPESQL